MPENWTPRPSLNVARAGLASATARGRIYAIGGFSAGFEASLDSVELRNWIRTAASADRPITVTSIAIISTST